MADVPETLSREEVQRRRAAEAPQTLSREEVQNRLSAEDPGRAARTRAAFEGERDLGREWREVAQSAGMGAAQAFAMGWADETIGALRSLATGQPYEEERRDVRQAFQGAQEQAPGAFAVGSLAGGAGIGIPALSRVAPRLTAGQRAFTAPIGGAGLGAMTGAGEAPTMADVPGYAGIGATLGGAAGVAAPLVTGGGRAAIASAMNRRVDAPGGDRFTRDELARMMEGSGYTPAELAERQQQFGPGTTAADVLGETGAEELRQAIKTQPARGPARRFLERRQDQERDVVEAETRRALGIESDIPSTEARMRAQRASTAAPLYREAYGVPVQMTPELQAFMETPAVQSAYRNAQTRARNRMEPLDPEVMDFRTLDEIKRSLDDRVNTLRRSKGAGNNDFQAARDLRDSFREYIKSVNPPYANALQAYAGDSAMLDAMNQGRDIFRTSGANAYTHRELRDMWADMTDSEKASFRMGVIDAVEGRMDTIRENANAARDFMTRGIQNKMDIVMEAPEAAAQFAGRMRGVQQRRETASRALGGSNTARDIIGAQERVQRAREATGIARRLPQARYTPGTLLDVMFDVGNMVLRRRNIDATPDQRRRIAEALLDEDQTMLNAVLRDVGRQELQGTALRRWSNRIANAMIGAAANPTIVQQAMGPEQNAQR